MIDPGPATNPVEVAVDNVVLVAGVVVVTAAVLFVVLLGNVDDLNPIAAVTVIKYGAAMVALIVLIVSVSD